MGKRIARLFTIKTRFEAYLVTWAIAMGAAERARHYLESYGTGPAGILLALCCSGVVFVAGAKLLDAVRREQADALVSAPAIQPSSMLRHAHRHPMRPLSRNRPRSFPTRRDGASRSTLRTD